MIALYSYPSDASEQFLRRLRERGAIVDETIEARVKGILEEVRKKGDRAIVEYTRAFDCPDFEKAMIAVSDDEIEKAYEEISGFDRDFTDIIRRAADNVREFHEAQKERSWFMTRDDGVFLGQMVRPVESVGAYIPGGAEGATPLISTVIMTVIPARVAGVKEIAIASPPRKDGTLHPGLLVTAKECGAQRIYRMGSAWAVAAFAWGTETVKPVNIIVGPGNIYVTTAKRLLMGIVGVDIIAGPSEVLIIADETANPVFVAADLLSQAEHDTYASPVLITWNKELAEGVIEEVKRQVRSLPRRDVALEALTNYGACFLVENEDVAAELANRIAPEHLELHVKTPWDWLGKITNAGALFIGHYTPEPLGDYFAGPNHVLPTSQTARFASALGVQNFLRRISLLHYPEEAFFRDASAVERMARWEGLEAHARSISIRKKNG
ncbi:histidinol dehydrogenase [Thermodesulforhabdus norvegica]|uniref:Histidinol dehydrogenase n=1 Tax=Thermodesulforhabdus norvegica TaxID=39841 RepID=A0A1I4TQG4_9BACT|nr:histidinol dehydrogenase [Thermodesulforhabdus norvegica]SFM78783.1 histidinol dehydrogenase [Thermodesulforhabdus norvegica]